jgi:hypothetical protein
LGWALPKYIVSDGAEVRALLIFALGFICGAVAMAAFLGAAYAL